MIRTDNVENLYHHIPNVVQMWYEKLAPTDYSPHDSTTIRGRLTEIVKSILESFENNDKRVDMQKLGKKLARLHYMTPESIAVSLETLAAALMPLASEHARPVLISCLSEMTAGFFHEVRGTLLKEQESVQDALTSQRQLVFDELIKVYSATASLYVPYDLRETSRYITEVVVWEFQQADCAILLIDSETTQLQRMARTGDFDVQTPQPLFINGPGLIPRAIREGIPVYAPDVNLEPDYVRNDSRTRSELVIPLRSGDDIIGAMDLQSTRLDAFSEQDRRVLIFFADRAADAIVNARLRDLLTEHTMQLEDRVAQRTAELMRTKDQIESILNSSSDAIFLAYAEGIVRQSNPAFNSLFGYDPDQIFGLMVSDLVTPASLDTFQTAFNAVVATSQNRRVEIVMRRKNSLTFNADVAISAIAEAGNAETRVVICSVRDISEQKWLEETLRENLLKERELNEMRTHFSSMLSHEFRNPLATILSASEMLRNYGGRMQPEEQSKYLDRIRIQVQQLTGLIEDILMVNKARAVALTMSPAVIDVVAFCKSLLNEMPSEHTGRVEFSSTCSQYNMSVDPKLLKLCVTNLLSNAFKYSPKDRPVQLRVLCGDGVQIEVEDHGIGIPPEDQKKLFTDFFRAGNVGDRQGTGLGLVVVKHVIELHGGSISFKSEVNVGTTFTLTLPVSKK